MKPSGIFSAGVLLLLFLELENVPGIQSARLETVYVSKTHGHDARVCGSTIDSPCKTLSFGFKNLQNGGRLFVDGSRTEEDPYTCGGAAAKRLSVDKWFTMDAYTFNSTRRDSKAYISCPDGITFQSNPRNITINGIAFVSTTITLQDATAVLNDCVFKGSTPSIVAKVTKSVNEYFLSVSNSVFQGNTGCIHINSKNARCNTVTLNLSNVTFQDNTAARPANEESSSLGIVSVRTAADCDKKTTVLSHWRNVTVINNQQTTYSHGLEQSDTRILLPSGFLEVHAHMANLSFSRVYSQNNTALRFLTMNCSSYSNVLVEHSGFTKHRLINKTGAVFHITSDASATNYKDDRYRTMIDIVDSELWDNVASNGGILQINTHHTVRLTITNSTMMNSYGTVTGCAVCVGEAKNSSKEIPSKLFALFDGFDIYFSEPPCLNRITSHCYLNRLGLVYLSARKVLDVRINNSDFWSNGNPHQPVFKIALFDNSFDKYNTLKVVVVNTIFDENKSRGMLNVVVLSKQHTQESRLTIQNSVFTGNLGPVLKTYNVKSIYIKNVVCKETKGVCYIFSNGPNQPKPSVQIIKSLFRKNANSPLIIYQKDVAYTHVLIKNSSFESNFLLQSIKFSTSFKDNGSHLIGGQIILDQVNFTSNTMLKSELLAFMIYLHKDNLTILMRNCNFKDNQQLHKNNRSIISTLIYVSLPAERGYIAKYENKDCEFIFNYTNYFFLKDVRFENNTCYSSLMYINNGRTMFSRCVFKDNYSHQPTISAYVFVELGSASVYLQSTSFIQTKLKTFKQTSDVPSFVVLPSAMAFFYYSGQGPLILRNSSFLLDAAEETTRIFVISIAEYFDLDQNTSLACPVGSFIDIENSSHVIPAECSVLNCTMKQTRINYLCKRCPSGFYSLMRGQFQGTKKNYVECLKCPFGGKCTENIQSKWTFWGYETGLNPPQLKFTRCPEKYCKFPKSHKNFSRYNYCNGNRTGVLCGSCKSGYTESMFNNHCRPKSECKNNWFWLIAVAYALAMALFIVYQPSIVLLLVRKILWFTDVKESTSHDHHHEHGYSKIIFFHYQIAILYSVNPEILVQKYKVIFSIVSLYNFEIKQADGSFGCPFPGLNAVTKQLFRSLQVFVAMAVVVVVYMVYWLICLLTRRTRPYFAAYMAAIVEILLLGYERLGHTSLELLDCTPLTMNGRTEWRLFLDGNITCWVDWWQYALIAYNVIFVVPFLAVLLIGTRKLRHQQITAVQFVAACFVPLPFLVYWIMKYFSKTGQTSKTGYQKLRMTLLDIIQGPFKAPSSQSKGTLYWESVLIGRRLIFLCLRFLISSPMFRLLPMTLVSMAILVHEVVVLPYNDNKANALSILTLSINVALATVNLCKSTLYSFGIYPDRRAGHYFEGLQMLEIALLCVVPTCLAVLIVAAIVAQAVRGIMNLCHPQPPLPLDKTEDDVTQRLICPVDEDDSDQSIHR